MNINRKKTIIITGLVLSSTFFKVELVQAANLTYDFTVNVTAGSLVGQQGVGSFSYDDSTLNPTNNGNSATTLSTLNLNFLENNYTLADGVPFDYPGVGVSPAEVGYVNGRFDGINVVFLPPPAYSGLADFSDGTGFNIFGKDIYIPSSASDSVGVVNYSLNGSSPAAVPEPHAIFGVAILGLSLILKRKAVFKP